MRAQGARVSDLCCGAEHSMALAASGEVFAWGWGAYGNLGDGHQVDRWTPVKVSRLELNPACECKELAGAFLRAMVQMQQCLILCFQSYRAKCVCPPIAQGVTDYQLASVHLCSNPALLLMLGTWSMLFVRVHESPRSCFSVPSLFQGMCADRLRMRLQVLGLEGVRIVSVACGWRHSIAADDAGVVYTFGWCKYGQLGHGDCRYSTRLLVPLNIPGQAYHPHPTPGYEPVLDRLAFRVCQCWVRMVSFSCNSRSAGRPDVVEYRMGSFSGCTGSEPCCMVLVPVIQLRALECCPHLGICLSRMLCT